MNGEVIEIDFPEALAYRIIAALLTLGLFIYWRKKNALKMYQAWALFYFFMNLTLAYHDVFNVLTRNGRLMLSIAFFANNLIVVTRSWMMSHKYIPKKKVKNLKENSKGMNVFKVILREIIAKLFAFFVTMKEGGNNESRTNEIKEKISKNIL